MKPYPSYKYSGFEWVGEIPNHWNVRKLKYLVRLRNEKSQSDSGPTIALENIESNTGQLITTVEQKPADGELKKFYKDDVLFNKLRPYLAKVVHASYEGRCVGELLVLIPEKLTSRFLFYRAISSIFIREVNGSTYGSKMPRASWNDFISQLSIPFPDKNEQHLITNYLDEKTTQIDEAIRKKQRLIEMLQEERTAFINQMVARGLDANVKMKPSGVEWLGDVPKHWEVKRLSNVASMLTGYAFQSEKFSLEHGTKLVRGDNVTEGCLRWGEKTRYWQEKDETLARFSLNENDVLISMDGSKVGKNYAMVTQEDLPLLLVQRVARIRSNNISLQEWIYFWVGSLFFRQYVDNVRTDPAIPHITLKDIKDFPVTLPPLSALKDLLRKLKATVDGIGTAISLCEMEINVLQEYRTALINEVVTGKVCVV